MGLLRGVQKPAWTYSVEQRKLSEHSRSSRNGNFEGFKKQPMLGQGRKGWALGWNSVVLQNTGTFGERETRERRGKSQRVMESLSCPLSGLARPREWYMITPFLPSYCSECLQGNGWIRRAEDSFQVESHTLSQEAWRSHSPIGSLLVQGVCFSHRAGVSISFALYEVMPVNACTCVGLPFSLAVPGPHKGHWEHGLQIQLEALLKDPLPLGFPRCSFWFL